MYQKYSPPLRANVKRSPSRIPYRTYGIVIARLSSSSGIRFKVDLECSRCFDCSSFLHETILWLVFFFLINLNRL